MKNLSLVILSVVLSVASTPLGDRAVFRRHSSVPVSRRYILESRTTAPPACAAALPPASSTDPSSTDIPTVDPTTTDPSSADSSSSSRRSFWSRDLSFGESIGIDDKFVAHDSTAISFEESVSTFVSTWETLCLSSGGDIFTNDPCTSLGGFAGIDALLETADPCDQHFIADSMITFAKSEGIVNSDDLINFAISFRRHARNAVKVLDVIPSSLFCLEAPINTELIGVYNEQLEGCDPGLFGSPTTSMVPFGSSGTCPLGMSADVDSCSCVSDGSDDTSDSSADCTDDCADATDSSDSSDDSSDCTDCSDSTDDSSDSTDDSSDSADDSSDSTDDSSDSSDDSGDATSTDTADASSSTDASSTDTADASSSTDASSTDTADASASTDASSTDTADASSTTDASTTDSADVSSSTDSATSTDSADASTVTPPPSSTVTPPPSSTVTPPPTSTNTFLTGVNFQPTDIAGDVNDPDGRRK